MRRLVTKLLEASRWSTGDLGACRKTGHCGVFKQHCGCTGKEAKEEVGCVPGGMQVQRKWGLGE